MHLEYFEPAENNFKKLYCIKYSYLCMTTHVDLSSDRLNDLCIDQMLKCAIDFVSRRIFRSFTRIQIVNDMP